MTDAPPPPRRPLRRGSLSQARIVDAAIELVERDGVDALTMRHLAAHLGCEPMSLYKHVEHKDALLDLVVERVVAGFHTPDPGLRWDERVRISAAELRRLAAAHPHAFPLVALRLPAVTSAIAPIDAVLAALADSGLDDDGVVGAFWALIAYTTGALLAETSAAVGVEQPFPFRLGEVDAKALPHVARLAGRLAASDWRTEYDRGLELLLSSIAAQARAARRVRVSAAGRGA